MTRCDPKMIRIDPYPSVSIRLGPGGPGGALGGPGGPWGGPMGPLGALRGGAAAQFTLVSLVSLLHGDNVIMVTITISPW